MCYEPLSPSLLFLVVSSLELRFFGRYFECFEFILNYVRGFEFLV